MANTVAYSLPRSFPNPAAKYGNRSRGTTKVDYRSKSARAASEKSSAPWLLVHDPPEECRSNSPSIRYNYFRNLSGDTIIKKRDVRFDEVFDRDLPKHWGRYFGCSDGWVSCTVPPSTYNSKPSHRLFDYFGRSDSYLVSAYPVPHIDIDPLDYLVDPGFPSTYGLERLVMSSSHPFFDDDECRLMAIRGRSTSLATCIPGFGGSSLLEQLDIWTMLQMEPYKNCGYQDVIYSNEDQCFYAIRGEFPSPYWIEAWDVRNIDCPKGNLIRANSILDQYGRHPNPNYIGGGGVDELQDLRQTTTRLMEFMTEKRYLVESSGDIYLVSRFFPRRFSSSGGTIQGYKTREEEKERLDKESTLKVTYVHKLDKTAQEWKYVKSLGDQAFFIGANQSFSVDATDFPWVMKRNSIYFMDENFKDGHIVGVYNLETGIEEEIFSNRNNPTVAPPVWIQTLPDSLL